MATKGKGAKVHLYDSVSTNALVKIGEMVSVQPPQPSRDTIDTTNHDSTGDYREFIASLIDAGEATVNVNYNPGDTTEDLVTQEFSAGELTSMAIDFNKPGGGAQRRMSFACIVTSGLQISDVVIDDKMTASFTVKVSGPITFADAPVA